MSRPITAPGHPAPWWTEVLDPLEAHEPAGLLGLGPGDRLVLAVPHPDDETLAVGGSLQRLHISGVRLVMALVTAGEAAYGESGRAAAALGRVRIREFHEAIRALGIYPLEIHLLDLPDGRLAAYESAILEALTGLLGVDPLGAEGRTVVLAPWIKDPHPDHRSVGRAAGAAARHTGSLRWSYPVWMRHGLRPDDPEVPWPDIRRVALSTAEREKKRAAIERYASQLDGPTAEIGAVLPGPVIEHFTDGHELLIRPAPGDDELAVHFEALYAGNADPWEVGTSGYERRKRSVLLASLPRERYACGWEPGCGLGHLTVELGNRCDRLLASDISPEAVRGARQRIAAQTAHSPETVVSGERGACHVEVAQTPSRPPDLAPASCDLVVLSEFLYYLTSPARAATIDLALGLLRAGGHLVVVHWRDHPADAHCSGEQANAEALAATGSALVHHLDESFVLDIAGKE